VKRRADNDQKSAALASRLFPGERWIPAGQGIYFAASREPRSNNQAKVFEKELAQARILAGQGAVVYLLPEIGPSGKKHPDAVVNGLITEFKTITGSIKKVEDNFKEARKKAENVFLKIDTNLSRETVQRKLEGVILQKNYRGGLVIVYLKAAGALYYWNVDDLK